MISVNKIHKKEWNDFQTLRLRNNKIIIYKQEMQLPILQKRKIHFNLFKRWLLLIQYQGKPPTKTLSMLSSQRTRNLDFT